MAHAPAQVCVDARAIGAASGVIETQQGAGTSWMSMISAQMHFAFVARENRYTLSQIML